MNKKILISLAVIGVVAAIAIGGTIAYFSDTETSTGNTFTAGSIDLKVDLVGTDPANKIAPFSEKDLNGQKLFEYADLKPGDSGEGTISLHVHDNDAWACMKVQNLANAENGCTEPESDPNSGNDQTCDIGPQDPGVGLGELQNYLRFSLWRDGEQGQPGGCNNVYDEQYGEQYIYKDKLLRSDRIIPIADSSTGISLTGSRTYCLGVSWNLPGDTGNIVQTDSMTGDVVFDAVQSKNNTNFHCVPPPQPIVTVTDTWSVVDTDSEGGESANLGEGQQHFEWFAKNRINNSGFEMAIGTDDAAPAGQNTADTVWVSGQQESFTLSYDGSSSATLSVANHPSVSFAVGAGTFGRIGINVKARNSAGRTTSLSNLVFSLGSLSPDNVSVTNGIKSLTISGVDMSSAWTLTGKFTFTWDTIGASEDQAVQFSID